ncbi:ABC transporter ATP-binding protein [Aquabacterium soli]|uniref:ABC transporter ATP-binding protein n=1 Tax=Aquabacterium soli TaxID=2493092 RepID=A0A3R8U0I8_9BURK|nr:ABC transporter ATP-binding protein [Aquabacterium soli]
MPASPPAPPVLSLHGITKRFGPLVANDNISLDLRAGEVLALLGENGAGKSTLVSILFGHYVADGGHIEAFGRPLPPGQPRAALDAGIGMVHQHFTLADNLSVLDNVMLGTEPLWSWRSRRGAGRRRLDELAQRFGLQVRPEALVGSLSVGERQRVEILKALYRGARILILDEPTAVLTPQESEQLFATLDTLVKEGLAVIFISHKLDEVLRVSNRVAVLRGGKLVYTGPTQGTSKAELATTMVGREVVPPRRPATAQAPGALVLNCQGVHTVAQGHATPLAGIDLRVLSGEILAVAGVSGNGQVALAELLHGLIPVHRGRLEVQGRTLLARPRDWVGLPVARIPEDRHAQGVVGDLSLWENTITERLRDRRFARWGWVRRAAARAHAQSLIQRFDVRGGGPDVPARRLSGGNMQKLVLGRALALGDDAPQGVPTLIVAAQPTWGLDVGAVAFVHESLLEAAAKGSAVLLISEDLDEILALADRIAVMHQGHLTPARPRAAWTLASLGLAMAGSSPQASTSAATTTSNPSAP